MVSFKHIKLLKSKLSKLGNTYFYKKENRVLSFKNLQKITDPYKKRYRNIKQTFKWGDVDYSKSVTVEVPSASSLPEISVPLPGLKETRKFVLKPLTNTIVDLSNMLKKADPEINNVVFESEKNIRLSYYNSIDTLIDENFILVINDVAYPVCVPERQRATRESMKTLDDYKNLVQKLYKATYIHEHQINIELLLCCRLAELRNELRPMESKFQAMNSLANDRFNFLAWCGLAVMGMQFGALARMTWWEYSWDIVEPISQFAIYFAEMLFFSYFLLCNDDYIMRKVYARTYLRQMHRIIRKNQFDIEKYNDLKTEYDRVELYMKRLRERSEPSFTLIADIHDAVGAPDYVRELNDRRITRDALESRVVCETVEERSKTEIKKIK